MPTGKKNGWSLKDKLIARLPDYAATASRFAGLLNLRNKQCRCWRPGRKAAGLLGEAQPARMAAARTSSTAARGATREEVLAATKPVVLFVDTFNGFFESENAQAAFRCCRPPATRCTSRPRQGGRQAPVLRPHLPGQRHGGRSQGQGGELLEALQPFAERASPSSAWSPRAC
jgi:hypothetical protein